MALDPSIILQTRGVQLDNPIDTQNKLAQLYQARSQNRLADMNFADSQREREGENALSRMLADGQAGDDVVRGLAGQGFGKAGLAYGKQFQDRQKGAADISKVNADVLHLAAQTAETQAKVTNMAALQHRDAVNMINDRESAIAWTQSMYSDPRLKDIVGASGTTVDQAIARIPQGGPELENWKMKAALGGEQLIKQTRPDANARLQSETSRANNADSNAVAMRGQNMTDARLGLADAPLALTDDAVLDAAHRYSVDGTLPPMGMGKNGATGRTTILNKAAEVARAAGVAPEDIRAGQITNKGQGSAMAQIQKQKTMVGAFERNFIKNADIAVELSETVDRTGVPILNKWINSGKRAIGGDPALAAFDASIKAVANEYAKIISGSMGNTSTAIGEIKKIEGLLNTAQTPAQVKSVIALMKRETKNRMDGFDEEIEGLRNSIRTGAPSKSAAPIPAAKPSLNDIFGK